MAGEIYTVQDLVRSISIHISTDYKFRRFQRMYSRDRIAFMYDIMPALAKTITPYQIEILGLFDNGYTRVGVRSPHGSGKTTIASVLTHHSVLTAEEDCKVPTTASAWRQLEKYLWPEIKKTERMIDWTKVGRDRYNFRTEFFQLSIRLRNGLVEAFALSSDDEQTIEGAHATRLVYIFDEAKAIPRKTWDAAEGAFANANISVKGDPESTIYNIDDYVVDAPAREINEEKSNNVIAGNGVNNSIIPVSSVNGSGSDLSTVPYDGDSIVPHSGNSAPSHAPSIRDNSQIADDSSKSMILADPHKTIQWHSHRMKKHDVIKTNIAFMQQITTYEALALAISTPGIPSGQFYDIMSRKPGYEHWQTKHITLEEAIYAGRISASWAEQMKRQWGEMSSQYQNRVLGNFAEESEETIIPLTWIEAAVTRWIVWNRTGQRDPAGYRRSLGVDVARLGTDKTVIADRHASVIRNVHSFSKLHTTETAGRVKVLATGKKVNIEMDGGLGAAVFDMLREDENLRKNLVPITVSASTGWRDKSGKMGMFNVRTAMWWHLRELLDPEEGSDICLPDNDLLIGDLSSPKWEMMKDAVVKMESKKDIISRLGRSTDYGDAVCLAFWEPTTGGGIVF